MDRWINRSMDLFTRHRRFATRDGEHDADADRDDETNRDPDGIDVRQDVCLPEREEHADHEHGIADEIEIHIAHRGLQAQTVQRAYQTAPQCSPLSGPKIARS